MIKSPLIIWPLLIDPTNSTLAWTVGGVAKSGDLPQGTTFYGMDDLIAAIQAVFNASASGTYTVGWGLAANYAISIFIGVQANTWKPTNSNGWSGLGFVTAIGAEAAWQYADQPPSNMWAPNRGPSNDSRPYFKAVAAQTVAMAGNVKTLTYAEAELRDWTFDLLRNYKAKIDAEAASRSNDGLAHPREAFERFWRNGRARFRYVDDWNNMAAYADYALDIGSINDFNPARSTRKELFSVRFTGRKWV